MCVSVGFNRKLWVFQFPILDSVSVSSQASLKASRRFSFNTNYVKKTTILVSGQCMVMSF